jgi:catechol 2,3-dioxygenase-like lactoylglutathione lyase family enzyme
MLLDGFNHVAVLTGDTDAFVAFYSEVFGAEVIAHPVDEEGMRLTLLKIGPRSELNVFELAGSTEHERQTPMFGRGRLDHIGLQAADLAAFEQIRDELMARGCTDGFVTDFGMYLSLFFTDPEGLEAEVLVENPDAEPGVVHPPGTPALRFHPPGTTPTR